MIGRFCVPLLALSFSGALAQISLYGPTEAHLVAGDAAPDIAFTQVLSAPGSRQWDQSNLQGQLTILVFSLRPSQNPQIVTLWNKLVDKYADKPVQFLFVSGEPESTLLPWLGQHPIKGWVFQDLDGKTGNAYGLHSPSTVFIGMDGKILGFGFGGFPPQDAEVDAALEGRINTKRPTRATWKAFQNSHLVLLNAEPFRFPSADEYKPKIPPSYVLHVSPSPEEEGGNFSGPDFKFLRSYTLREAISNVYFDELSVNPNRVFLPQALDDNRRYDFSLVLPEAEDQNQIKSRMQQGIEDYFHLTVRRENRLLDVYVVTVTPGYAPPVVKRADNEMRAGGGGGGIDFERNPADDSGTMEPLSLNAVRGISYSGTVDGFCRMLEGALDRPVIDETNWDGEIKIRVERKDESTKPFPERLREQFGLDISPTQRSIETLIFDLR